MKTIKAEPITKEAFRLYGEFYNMYEPEGFALTGPIHDFYPDRVLGEFGQSMGFSPLIIHKPEKMIVDSTEYHSHSWEMVIPLNDDMVIHVAEPTGYDPQLDRIKAFIVPKGTLIKYNAGVWHKAPMPIHEDTLYTMAVLGQCAYIHDCRVYELTEEEQMEIVL